MLKLKLTILFVFLSLLFFAQKNEIGVSLLAYNTFKDNVKVNDTASYSKINGVVSFQPVFCFNHISSKNVDLYLQTGFFYEPGQTKAKATDASQYVTYSNSSSLKKSVYLKLGVAKRYYFEKLVFACGVNIPFQYEYYQYSDQITNYYDNTGYLNSISEATDNRSPYYITGVNLNESLHYEVLRNLYLGLDLNFGYQTTIIKGSRKYISRTTDYSNGNTAGTTTVTEQNVNYNWTAFGSLNFQPNFSIRYCLTKR